MELLTVKEVAELSNCTKQNVTHMIRKGYLPYKAKKDNANRLSYLIPLESLDKPLQVKWYRQKGLKLPKHLQKQSKEPKEAKPLESYTLDQRKQIEFWIKLINDWQEFREDYDRKTDADDDFLKHCRYTYPDMNISATTLYRRLAAYKDNDLDGLIEKRGLWKKGKSSIPDDVWKVFLSYYLDQAQHSVVRCHEYTKQYFEVTSPDMLDEFPQSLKPFYTRIEKDIPEAVEVYNRVGAKALHDRCAPYIRRVYDSMMSNDYWVADNHTFDFFSQDENGRQHRLYLTAYLDARSTAIVGWKVTHAPCGDATLSALRMGIEKNGIPTNIYVDNGSEFLVHDIGGRGHRKRKKDKDRIEPPGVFARLGINMINAIPGNPEAKIIERIFRDVKDFLSRAIDTFSGGSVAARPEQLSGILKNTDIITDAEIVKIVDQFIEGNYNHMPYNGSVKADHGKTKMQVYMENLVSKKVPASAEDLNLMMMRSSRPVKVGRRGVKLDVAGASIDYFTEAFLTEWKGKQIYYRYDPDDIRSIRVYNADKAYMDQYICTLPADNIAMLEYGADTETIKAGMQVISRYNNAIKKWTDGKVLNNDEKISVYTLMQIKAQERIENPPEYMNHKPKIVELVRAVEDSYQYPMAVGDNGAILSDMINNIKQRKLKEETSDDYE